MPYSHNVYIDVPNHTMKISFNLSQYGSGSTTMQIISTGVYISKPSNLSQFESAFNGANKYTVELTGPSITTPIVRTLNSNYFTGSSYNSTNSTFYIYLEFVDSFLNYLLPSITFNGLTSTPTLFNIYIENVCIPDDIGLCPLTCDTTVRFDLCNYNPGNLPPSIVIPTGIENTGIGTTESSFPFPNVTTANVICQTINVPSSMNVPDMAYDATGLCFYYPFAFKSSSGYPIDAIFNGIHIKFTGDIVNKISTQINLWTPPYQSTEHIIKLTSYDNSVYPPTIIDTYTYWATHVNVYYDGIHTNILLTIRNQPWLKLTSLIIDPNYILVELYIKLIGTFDTSLNYPIKDNPFSLLYGVSYKLTNSPVSNIGNGAPVSDFIFFNNPPNTSNPYDVNYYPVAVVSITGNSRTHVNKSTLYNFGDVRTDQSNIINNTPIIHPVATCFHYSTIFHTINKTITQLTKNDLLKLEDGSLVKIDRLICIPWGKPIKFVYFRANCFELGIPKYDLKVTEYHHIKYKDTIKFAKKWLEELGKSNNIYLFEENIPYLYHILTDVDQSILFIDYGGLFVDVWGKNNKYLKKLL